MKDRPLETLRQRFPLELQRHNAVHEIPFDDNSRLTFISLQNGGYAVQIWKPGSDRCGHGFLLCGSAFLDENEIDTLIDSLVLKRRLAS